MCGGVVDAEAGKAKAKKSAKKVNPSAAELVAREAERAAELTEPGAKLPGVPLAEFLKVASAESAAALRAAMGKRIPEIQVRAVRSLKHVRAQGNSHLCLFFLQALPKREGSEAAGGDKLFRAVEEQKGIVQINMKFSSQMLNQIFESRGFNR